MMEATSMENGINMDFNDDDLVIPQMQPVFVEILMRNAS